MGKPCEYPWNYKNQQRLPETRKYILKILIFLNNKVHHNFTNNHSDMAHIELQEIVKIGLSGLLHHEITNIVSEDSNKDRGYVMKSLNIPEIWVMAKEIV